MFVTPFAPWNAPCIDGRYVQELEEENIYLRNQLAQLQNAYYTESIKSQGLAQALQIVNNK